MMVWCHASGIKPKAGAASPRESELGLLWSREEVGYFGLSLELGLIEFIFLFLRGTVRKDSQGDRDGAGAGA